MEMLFVSTARGVLGVEGEQPSNATRLDGHESMVRKTTQLVFGLVMAAAACGRGAIAPTDLPSGAALTTTLAAKGGKPTALPATALFRCPGAACAGGDQIQADGFDASYSGADGAQLDIVSEFSLRPTGTRE